jgi:hypothetical protein
MPDFRAGRRLKSRWLGQARHSAVALAVLALARHYVVWLALRLETGDILNRFNALTIL